MHGTHFLPFTKGTHGKGGFFCVFFAMVPPLGALQAHIRIFFLCPLFRYIPFCHMWIRSFILDKVEDGVPEHVIIQKLQKHFMLDEETARGYCKTSCVHFLGTFPFAICQQACRVHLIGYIILYRYIGLFR